MFFNLFCNEKFVFKDQSQYTIILTVIASIDVFLPKATVIFAQGDTVAGTVVISVAALPRRPGCWF